MIKKIYYWFHKIISRPEERGEYSSGYWQDIVRRNALGLFDGGWKNVLEVGCGEGLFLTELASSRKDVYFCGVDNWKDILKKAEARINKKGIKNIELYEADAASLPFEDSYFDAVYCINVIFNLKSLDTVEKTIDEMARVCKIGGKIIFDIRNSANPFLYLKYRLAPLYDETVKNLPLVTYKEKDILPILDGSGLKISRKLYIGSLVKKIAPLIILEAVKR